MCKAIPSQIIPFHLSTHVRVRVCTLTCRLRHRSTKDTPFTTLTSQSGVIRDHNNASTAARNMMGRSLSFDSFFLNSSLPIDVWNHHNNPFDPALQIQLPGLRKALPHESDRLDVGLMSRERVLLLLDTLEEQRCVIHEQEQEILRLVGRLKEATTGAQHMDEQSGKSCDQEGYGVATYHTHRPNIAKKLQHMDSENRSIIFLGSFSAAQEERISSEAPLVSQTHTVNLINGCKRSGLSLAEPTSALVENANGSALTAQDHDLPSAHPFQTSLPAAPSASAHTEADQSLASLELQITALQLAIDSVSLTHPCLQKQPLLHSASSHAAVTQATAHSAGRSFECEGKSLEAQMAAVSVPANQDSCLATAEQVHNLKCVGFVCCAGRGFRGINLAVGTFQDFVTLKSQIGHSQDPGRRMTEHILKVPDRPRHIYRPKVLE